MDYELEPIVGVAFKGNASALEFTSALLAMMHVWDDLADKDKACTDEDINAAFTIALVGLHSNPFFVTHRGQLSPLIINAITNWRIATQIEREESSDALLTIAFIIRSAYVDILTMCATLIGGIDWGVQQGRILREAVHHEGMTGYLEHLKEEKEKRDGTL